MEIALQFFGCRNGSLCGARRKAHIGEPAGFDSHRKEGAIAAVIDLRYHNRTARVGSEEILVLCGRYRAAGGPGGKRWVRMSPGERSMQFIRSRSRCLYDDTTRRMTILRRRGPSNDGCFLNQFPRNINPGSRIAGLRYIGAVHQNWAATGRCPAHTNFRSRDDISQTHSGVFAAYLGWRISIAMYASNQHDRR